MIFILHTARHHWYGRKINLPAAFPFIKLTIARTTYVTRYHYYLLWHSRFPFFDEFYWEVDSHKCIALTALFWHRTKNRAAHILASSYKSWDSRSQHCRDKRPVHFADAAIGNFAEVPAGTQLQSVRLEAFDTVTTLRKKARTPGPKSSWPFSRLPFANITTRVAFICVGAAGVVYIAEGRARSPHHHSYLLGLRRE